MSLDRAEKLLGAAADRGYQAVRVGALVRNGIREQDVLDAARALGFRLQCRAGEPWVILQNRSNEIRSAAA